MSREQHLTSIAPAPPSDSIESVDDLERILALPKRPPLDCTRDPVTKRYRPETQALIEVMTAKFARSKRLVCACRPRVVTRHGQSLLVNAQSISLAAFIADHQTNTDELAVVERVTAMRDGETIELPAADGGAGHPCMQELNPVQAWTLHEAPIVGGILGMLNIGAGKSATGILAPLAFPDSKLAMLLIEPKQRRHYRSQYLRLREHFRVPSIIFDGGDHGYTVPGTPPLHLVSYSILSRPENSDLLERRSPDLLILDEAHRATGRSSINLRCLRYLSHRLKLREDALARGEHVRDRATRFLAWSGTLESKSIADTHMLSTYGLGTTSPLPLHPDEMENWSAVFDPSWKADRESTTAKRLLKAFGGGKTEFDIFGGTVDRIREGFRERRRQTLGVITASASDMNASLYFSERKAPKIPEAIAVALEKVRESGERPDGEILVEKVEQVAAARNLISGFYLYWAFPKHKCACMKDAAGNSVGPLCEECQLIASWYAARKAYNKELRSKLLDGEKYLDSPKLCFEAAARYYRKPPYTGALPTWASLTWREWAEIEKRVEYEERVQWIDEYLAKDAAEWATTNKGIVWFSATAFGRKVAELSGLPYFNGGPGGEERLRAEKGDRSVICSIPAHGAGTDGLQHLFSEQLIAEPPASNSSQRGWQQLLGRLNRQGQKKDVVNTYIYRHAPELRDALRNSVEQAEFNAQMHGNMQYLLCADFDFDLL